MATVRKIVFRKDEIYHIFNRGLDRRSVFTDKRELTRAKELIKFYRNSYVPLRYSQFLLQPKDRQNQLLELMESGNKLVSIISYCLMPNHFHFLVKQLEENGITKFISNFTNGYTKYYNQKHSRSGPLFEGVFKAVYVETDEQFLHLSRYIHLNPVVSSIIKLSDLSNYQWSSYPDYIGLSNSAFCDKNLVLEMFKSPKDYERFVLDQVDYGKKLEEIKHLILE